MAAGHGAVDATLTVLGAGTFLPHRYRRSPAFLVEATGIRLLVDCGPGTVHGLADHGVAWQTLTHVAVSHYHLDHVGDLSALLNVLEHGVSPRRTAPLTLVGPPGFETFLGRLAAALGDHLLDPGFPVDVVELAEGRVLHLGASGAWLRAHPTPHTHDSVAFRVDLPDGAFGYSGDTAPSDEVASFLAGCRVLVMECAQNDPPVLDNHLSPRGVARMATRAAPGLLVLTHVYPPLTPDEAVAAVRRAGYDGGVVAGKDGLRLSLAGGGA